MTTSYMNGPEIERAKRLLDIDRLVMQIHDASFPSRPDEDIGRGSPYAYGAEQYFEFVAKLGFDAIQFGPRGMTDRGNPSPYDATLFSRNPLDLPWLRLMERGRLSRATWESIRHSLPPPREGVVPYPQVYDACQRALREIASNASAEDRAAAARFLEFHRAWLVPDALYGILCREHARGSWHGWGTSQRGALDQRLHHPAAGQELAAAARIEELKDRYSAEIDDYALIQWLLAQEHQALRERLKQLGLALYGDLQVGFSQRDEWAWQGLFLEGYCMGAPPSRTNPSGQPWGYAVLDPAKFGSASEPGPVLRFVRARIARVLTECDGLRIDHPHGWVDPWVYRTDLPDPFLAVQHGTRLFSSPDEPEHPRLASHAIARTSQINRAQPAYADRRVTDLDDAQVGRYSMLVDEIVAQQRSARHATSSVACEVLSTLPYPVGRVLERHGLGRFRVIQKADLTNPADVYRVENAQPQDWIMLGTHDTPPIWHLAEQWCRGEQGIAWARYLSNLLAPASDTESRQRHFTEAGQLVQACFSAMLASRARHVVVFFPDLLGMTKRYNEPGVVSEANWSLRVPSDFESVYTSRLARDAALNVRAGFSRALRRLDRSRPDA